MSNCPENCPDKRTPQEYEFIMDGITTRMQMALDKLAESNKLVVGITRLVCVTMIIFVLALLANNYIWIRHTNAMRDQTIVSEVAAGEEVSKLGPGSSD